MIVSYSEANRELDHILEFFLVSCAVESLVGVVQHRWWFAFVWFGAAILDAAIRSSARIARIAANPGKIDEAATDLAARSDELANQNSFASRFLRFTSLLAATIAIAGLTLGNTWWAALLVGLTTWFISLFGIPLLCAPRLEEEIEPQTQPFANKTR
jgi:hypothetical protein